MLISPLTEKIYRQTDVAAMRLFLVTVLADLFMIDLESYYLEDYIGETASGILKWILNQLAYC